ncbi:MULTISPECIES: hypothetical protein [unclassified Methylobacterium]|jgi:hypothetical protein|uniref:hypothetical protein n=1 Tax=unclassified Methylobacterium TaxID=2615210 RepID=UPI001354198D|nr:hypothetical protein [Methylobacterium sp. 2A]MWV21485.1 hypothetical protein [Methylobacterium sp. 2A]
MTGLALPVWTRSRGLDRRILAVLGSLVLAPSPATAQEPLFLRIRPISDAEAARAAREALWARRQAHARAVIESVCTGCLGAWKPTVETAPAAPPMRTPDAVANLTVRIGVETDPGAVASDDPDPSTSERHP